MKKIPLSKNTYAIVDDSDYLKVSKYKWYNHCGYAARKVCLLSVNGVRKYEHIFMHTFLNRSTHTTDHINGNKLDNRKSNLRKATYSQNNCNVPSHRDSTSSYKGVCWCRFKKRWRSSLCTNYKKMHLGYFKTEREAAIAYNKAAKKIHKDFAWINKI